MILVVVIFFLLSISPVYACQQIMSIGIEETVGQADLIIIGQKVAEGPIEQAPFSVSPEPIWFDVKITEILKGQFTSNSIRIKTDTACGYGFFAPRDEDAYIMFFQWDNYSESFIRVGVGGERMIKLLNNTISYRGIGSEWVNISTVNIDEFIQEFGLIRIKAEDVDFTKDDQNTTKITNTKEINVAEDYLLEIGTENSNGIWDYIYYIIGIIFILAFVLFLMLRKKKK